MAKEEKNIIEEALLDAQKIQEALNKNTKEILRSVAKEEIDSVADVDVSVDADDYEGDSEDIDYEDGAGDEMDAEEGGSEEMDYEDGMDGEMSMDGEMDMTGASDDEVISVYKKLSGDDEIEVVSDNEVYIKDPASGSEYHVKLNGSEEMDSEMEMDDELELDLGMDDEMEAEGMYEGDEAITQESEEITEDEVVYEITLDEDSELAEEIVRGKGHDTHLSDTTANSGDIDGQTSPVDNENSGDNLEGGFTEDDPNGSKDGHSEHVMNEDEEVTEAEEVTETEEVTEVEEVTEEDAVEENLAGTRGYAGRQGAKMGGDDHHPSRKDESAELLTKYNELVKENSDFKAILKKFRKMLAETVVYNANLTYVTKLFMEHATSKDEKFAILDRFDEGVNSLKESKKLYKTINGELTNQTPITESIDSKINESKGSGSSSSLNENTVYIDKETARIKDLMTRVEKK
jgi:hypothetical protein